MKDILDYSIQESKFEEKLYNILSVSELKQLKFKLEFWINEIDRISKSCLEEAQQDINKSLKTLSEWGKEFSQLSQCINTMISIEDILKYHIELPCKRIRYFIENIHKIEEAQLMTKRYILLHKSFTKLKLALDKSMSTVIDPVSACHTLKEIHSILSSVDLKGIGDADHISAFTKQVEDRIIQGAEKRIEEAFFSRDKKTLIKCIQIFFSYDTLNSQIQILVTNCLKSQLSSWKSVLAGITSNLGKSDDILLGLSVEEAIQQHCKDMLKCSLRVNTLCEVLNSRDIATSDTYEKILSKGGLSNLFGQYWSKMNLIVRQSLSKFKETPDNAKIYYLFVNKYPNFKKNLVKLWTAFVKETTLNYKQVYLLRPSLFESVDEMKELYLKSINEGLSKMIEKINSQDEKHNRITNIDEFLSKIKKLINDNDEDKEIIALIVKNVETVIEELLNLKFQTNITNIADIKEKINNLKEIEIVYTKIQILPEPLNHKYQRKAQEVRRKNEKIICKLPYKFVEFSINKSLSSNASNLIGNERQIVDNVRTQCFDILKNASNSKKIRYYLKKSILMIIIQSLISCTKIIGSDTHICYLENLYKAISKMAFSLELISDDANVFLKINDYFDLVKNFAIILMNDSYLKSSNIIFLILLIIGQYDQQLISTIQEKYDLIKLYIKEEVRMIKNEPISKSSNLASFFQEIIQIFKTSPNLSNKSITDKVLNRIPILPTN